MKSVSLTWLMVVLYSLTSWENFLYLRRQNSSVSYRMDWWSLWVTRNHTK